ncbi:hypothetical protein DBV15_09144 [Temnothorax longispinosus]|uniref:Uncharacterized protein n=1 Tax=Temnothorax longispinosus TaxID=300112 RepID=A0A4S2KBI2_9HYME|nr:hypothetical protein DBV15_09144 [Temnothorax longispinosus]
MNSDTKLRKIQSPESVLLKGGREKGEKLQDNAVSSKREGIAGACRILLSSVVDRKEGWCATRRTRRRESSVAHASATGDDDTIWSFAPEACDNITATCYVPHGRRDATRRHARELLTPSRRTRLTTDTSRTPSICTRAKVEEGREGGWGWVVWPDARRDAEEKEDGATSYPEVVDRRVLGRIFCIWICRICQRFFSDDASHRPFLLQTATSTRDRLFPPLPSSPPPPTPYVSHSESDNDAMRDVCRVRAPSILPRVKVRKRGLGLCVRRFIDTDLIFVKADATGEYASDPNSPRGTCYESRIRESTARIRDRIRQLEDRKMIYWQSLLEEVPIGRWMAR